MATLPHTITDGELAMLANIFRIIVKEIRYDEDKEKLAPGEIGISYTEGCIYVRNPHTGELFSPNSIKNINQITNKFDSATGILNADLAGGIRFYSDISQLTQLGITLSIDSIIRQMEFPGILMSPIKYENPEAFGFPSDNGMVLIHKVNTEFVMAQYYDCNTYTTYEGRYNTFTHKFDGWARIGSGSGSEYIESIGGGNQTVIKSDTDLKDMMIVTVRITETLEPGALISYNGGKYLPILEKDGTPLGTSIGANNIIMLVYDKLRSGWVWLSSTESSMSTILEITNSRLEQVTAKLEYTIKDYTERIIEVERRLDNKLAQLDAKPGNIVTVVSTFTAPIAAIDTINTINGFNSKLDKLVVNYNQTVLRPGIDYMIDGTGIRLKTFTLAKDDILQFIVIKQAATAQPESTS